MISRSHKNNNTMEIFEKVTTCGEYKDLQMRSFYRKGSGLCAHLLPTVRITDENGRTITTSFIINFGANKQGGKTFLVRPMTRNSKKTLAALETYMDANKKELARMYDADDWMGIHELLDGFNWQT